MRGKRNGRGKKTASFCQKRRKTNRKNGLTRI